MISALVLFGLCAPLAQEPVQQTLQIHEIDGLIDVQAEMKAQLVERLALEAALSAIQSLAADAEGGERLGLQLAGMALDASSDSDKEELFVSDLPLLSTLFQESVGSFAFTSAEDLLHNAKLYMTPPFDSETQGLKIEKTGEKRVLVSFLGPDQQQWLTDFLQMQREIDRWQALMKVQVFLAKPGAELSNDRDATVFNTAAQAEALGEKLKQSGAELVSAPSMLTLPGQQGTISSLNQSSYVSSWELTVVQPSGNVVADPTIEVVQEGMTLKSRALQVGKDSFGISIDVEMARIEKPFATKTITVEGQEFEIGAPEVVTANIATSMQLPAGGGVMLRSSNYDDGRDLVIIVTFERISAEK
jgi:hypothetical protein